MFESNLNSHVLSKRLRIDSTTILDRIRELDKQGIIEKTGERPGKKNREQRTALWSISSLGLWVAAHATPMITRQDLKNTRERKEKETKEIRNEALEKCEEKISKYWKIFTQIYQLDKVKTERPIYQSFTEWLNSDEGLLNFLDAFGCASLTSELDALINFARMMEFSLLINQMGWLPVRGIPQIEYVAHVFLGTSMPILQDVAGQYYELGELAANHERYGKLDSILFEVNRPWQNYLAEEARQRFIARIGPILGHSVAKRLSSIPILEEWQKYQNLFAGSAANLALDALRDDAIADEGIQLVIEDKKVTIRTNDSNAIRSEWKEYCDLEVLPKEGSRISAKRRRAQ